MELVKEQYPTQAEQYGLLVKETSSQIEVLENAEKLYLTEVASSCTDTNNGVADQNAFLLHRA